MDLLDFVSNILKLQNQEMKLEMDSTLMNLNSWSSNQLIYYFDNLPMCWEQFAKTEANQGSLEPEEVSDLEANVKLL